MWFQIGIPIGPLDHRFVKRQGQCGVACSRCRGKNHWACHPSTVLVLSEGEFFQWLDFYLVCLSSLSIQVLSDSNVFSMFWWSQHPMLPSRWPLPFTSILMPAARPLRQQQSLAMEARNGSTPRSLNKRCRFQFQPVHPPNSLNLFWYMKQIYESLIFIFSFSVFFLVDISWFLALAEVSGASSTPQAWMKGPF